LLLVRAAGHEEQAEENVLDRLSQAKLLGDFTVKALMSRLQYFVEKTDAPKPTVHHAASRKKEPAPRARPTVKKNAPVPATAEPASLTR
jgi:hypothetical protein